MALPAAGTAQSLPSGDLQFDVNYRRVSNVIRPARGQSADKIRVTFSLLGAERIAVTFNQGTGNEQHILRFGREIEYNKLGSKMVFQKEDWNRITRIITAPQTIETLKIVVTGENTCSATVDYELREGFDEHKLLGRNGKPIFAASMVADGIVCKMKAVKPS